jgi:Xaa-Pro aminopeptidase
MAMANPYAERRRRLLDQMGRSVLVVFAAPLAIRNNDVEHEYRQDSDFHYLTGFDEPEAAVILTGVHADEFELFVRPRDPEREVWDGPRAGVDGARAEFGAKVSFPTSELDEKLPDYLENAERLYYRLGRNRAEDDRILSAIQRTRPRARRGSLYPTEIVDPAVILHEMRRLKEDGELALMQRAIDITRDAHVAAMAAAHPGAHEYEIEAILRREFRRRGSERPAYEPIVGSGPNATVLHYRKNDRRMEDGDLLLVDAGSEYGYYASDVTRTYPVSGEFTEPQKRIYELVLRAQEQSILLTRPGANLDETHEASVRVITEGLIELGLCEGPLDDAIREERYKRYFMHKTSHYLGMDVHDVGRYHLGGKPRALEPGVVITVEPGVYVPPNDDKAAAEFRGIGVRIEDDVLVTASGSRVLSAAIPKSVADIELACKA